jgi:hypothetical protein
MRRRFSSPRSFTAAAPRNARPTQPAPLPGSIVDAVLRYHDEIQEQGCGRALLRLSASRLRDAEVAGALGELAARAAGVSILWDERESEIIRVLEAAAPRLAA